MGAWSSDSEGENNRELFYLSTEPGAAAREGWYDLDVQTSKRPFASARESGRWKQTEEWTRVQVSGGGATSDNLEGEEGGKKRAGTKKKKVVRESGKRARSHKSQADQSKSRPEAQSGGGGNGSGIGSGEATVAASAEDKNKSTHNGGQPPSSKKNSSSGAVGSKGGAGGREGNSSGERVTPDCAGDGYLPAAAAPVATGKGHPSSELPRPEKRRRKEGE